MNGVCDLKYAIELKDLGYKQEGIWWWVVYEGEDYQLGIYNKKENEFTFMSEKGFTQRLDKDIVAPTVAELGKALPYRVRLEFADYWLYISKAKSHWDIRYKSFSEGRYHSMGLPDKGMFQGDTLANAMAKMLIYLIKEGIVKL